MEFLASMNIAVIPTNIALLFIMMVARICTSNSPFCIYIYISTFQFYRLMPKSGESPHGREYRQKQKFVQLVHQLVCVPKISVWKLGTMTYNIHFSSTVL